MNSKQEILERVKRYMAVMEKENPDEFDMLTAMFAVLHETNALVGAICTNAKIKEWREKDDPSFYRFASLLKQGLEQQRDYLDSVSDQLPLEGDIVAQKIAAARERINVLSVELGKTQPILNEAETLLAQQAELSAKKALVDALVHKKTEIAALTKEYMLIDLEKLQAEVAQKEKELTDLKKKCAPLQTKQAKLQKEVDELCAAQLNLDTELARLTDAYGDKALEITGKIPCWIEQIKERRLKRQAKTAEYERELAKAAAELFETEKEIHLLLEKINQQLSAAMDAKEILTTHFEANQRISADFSGSLSGINNELLNLQAAIDRELHRFDALLSTAHRQIQTIAAACKPGGIGG